MARNYRYAPCTTIGRKKSYKRHGKKFYLVLFLCHFETLTIPTQKITKKIQTFSFFKWTFIGYSKELKTYSLKGLYEGFNLQDNLQYQQKFRCEIEIFIFVRLIKYTTIKIIINSFRNVNFVWNYIYLHISYSLRELYVEIGCMSWMRNGILLYIGLTIIL